MMLRVLPTPNKTAREQSRRDVHEHVLFCIVVLEGAKDPSRRQLTSMILGLPRCMRRLARGEVSALLLPRECILLRSMAAPTLAISFGFSSTQGLSAVKGPPLACSFSGAFSDQQQAKQGAAPERSREVTTLLESRNRRTALAPLAPMLLPACTMLTPRALLDLRREADLESTSHSTDLGVR